jgi:hypothetical protein
LEEGASGGGSSLKFMVHGTSFIVIERPNEEGIATSSQIALDQQHGLRENMRPNEEGIATLGPAFLAETQSASEKVRPNEEGIATFFSLHL